MNPRGKVHNAISLPKNFQWLPTAYWIKFKLCRLMFMKLPVWLAPATPHSSLTPSHEFSAPVNWIYTLFPEHSMGTPASTTPLHHCRLTSLSLPPLIPRPNRRSNSSRKPHQRHSCPWQWLLPVRSGCSVCTPPSLIFKFLLTFLTSLSSSFSQ